MKNTSGITPVEFNVLVKQDEVQERTAGGLYLSGDTLDREKHAQTRGVIVAVSPLAFNEDVWPQSQPKPEAGQKVAFAKHAGTFIDGLDGEQYRVIKDKDVVALIDG